MGYLMRSSEGWSKQEEGLFEVRADSFMSKELTVSDLNSLSIVFIVASSYFLLFQY